MSYPINYPTPQGANVQIFRGGDSGVSDHQYSRDWIKPQGASFVWFTLIGAGGGGGGSSGDGEALFAYHGGGGASGNVTNFMCPAFLLPDMLQVCIGRGGDGGANGDTTNPGVNGTAGIDTFIRYQQKDGSGYTILQASGGDGGEGAQLAAGIGGAANAADTGGPMTAAGFYNAVANQAGKNGSDSGTGKITVDNLTFVMGGSGRYYPNPTQVITGYYGYTASEINGYSQLSPIPLSMGGGAPVSSVNQIAASFGCGGNGGGNVSLGTNTYGSRGGDGLAIIVTW